MRQQNAYFGNKEDKSVPQQAAAAKNWKSYAGGTNWRRTAEVIQASTREKEAAAATTEQALEEGFEEVIYRRLRQEDRPEGVEIHNLATIRKPIQEKGNLKNEATGQFKDFKGVTIVRHQTQKEEWNQMVLQYGS